MAAARRVIRAARLGATLCAVALAAGGCMWPRDPLALRVWAAEDCRTIDPGTPPALENEIFSAARGQLRLSAAINETVAFQLVLSAGVAQPRPLSIHISDLAGKSAVLSARDAISIFRAHWVPLSHYRSWFPRHSGLPAAPRLFADVLVPWEAPLGGGPLRVDGTRNEIIWVDVRIPPDTAAGDYVGRVELLELNRDAPAFACELRLRVLPVAIPLERSAPLICRLAPADLFRAQLRWDRDEGSSVRLLPGAASHQPAVQLLNQTVALLQAHRANPVLDGSYPKFRPVGDRRVEVEWGPYDALVEAWLDGSAFEDRVGLARWLLPVSANHPDPLPEGGFDSPRFARLLSDYLTSCDAHFAERGWRDRALLRPLPPEPLTPESMRRIRRAAGIVAQSETRPQLVLHAPSASLRALGWFNAPEVELPDAAVLAPPAMWAAPAALARQRDLGSAAYVVPDQPPYAPSLAIEAPATDARLLPWLLFRYDLAGAWIEHAADFGEDPFTPDLGRRDHDWLVYPGARHGLPDCAIPSVRLKRLRRGSLDAELLRLLDRHGKRYLAESIARQVMRRALTDAALDHLLDVEYDGWTRDCATLDLARTLMLEELAGSFEPGSEADAARLANLARWARLMNRAERVAASVDGTRLRFASGALGARAYVSVSNLIDRPLEGRWTLPSPPAGWTLPPTPPIRVPPGGRMVGELDVSLAGLGSNRDGVFDVELLFESEAMGAFAAPARLAVSACPRVDVAPRIDGALDDWPRGFANAAGDFRLLGAGRLVAASGRDGTSEERTRLPTLATNAFFAHDGERLYVAVRCALRAGERPVAFSDNRLAMDGSAPWEQDAVEIILDPLSSPRGSTADLYVLQVKPNGLLAAYRGCPTQPPIGPVQPWASEVHARVETTFDAWTVELALPFSALPPAARNNRVWGLNVSRLDARRGEYSSWSAARRLCYAPQSLGSLIFAAP
ncbi:MAG: hypothetical protein CHACPFDD_01126 [Phycisphaerae bacterium]|nr:hypothetical protein [Phycisphaerae bacterium]